MFSRNAAWALTVAYLVFEASAQTTGKVDFAKDVQPVLRQNCYGCHGPAQQMGGLRLDRKSSVFKPGMRRVVPGSSENSFLYHRVSGSVYGLQMPPTGPLKAEQVALLKAWIDQGAPWPDALANEADRPPVNPKALSMVDALRAGDRESFLKSVADDPKLLNARGPDGSTPFMYAVLYGDATFLMDLVKRGADVNAHNDAKATPLMWAAMDLDKTRVLVARGANVNAQSDDHRSALMIAAGKPGGTPIVKFLLEHGANVNPTKTPMADSSPLMQASLVADAESMQMLIDAGANVADAAPMALTNAITWHCAKCVDLLIKKELPKDAYTFTLLNVTPYADAKDVALLLDHGAEVNAVDPFGRTALHYAAVSDLIPADVVKVLIDHGADVNARSQHTRSGDAGLSTLDMARLNGDTPVVNALLKAGAKGGAAVPATPDAKPSPAPTTNAAVQRSLVPIQQADASFSKQSGCISCHNNNIAAMAIGLARKNGYRVDEKIAAQQVKVNAAYLEHMRETLQKGFYPGQAGSEVFGDVFGPGVLGYVLVGLDAEHYPADLTTDAAAMYLKSRQWPDGQWAYPTADMRQPLCLDYIGQTALAMRALQRYAPKPLKAEYDRAVDVAAAWIENAEPKTTEDRFWKLQGLAWAGKNESALAKAAREVAALQRSDGGWAQMPSMGSDSYATGRALVALHSAGMPVSDPVYRKGVKFLVDTQMADGSWYVKTRALALQPFFDSGFPHGFNQAISAAASSWATMALTFAAPQKGNAAAE
jgi:ankyrin repeat protein